MRFEFVSTQFKSLKDELKGFHKLKFEPKMNHKYWRSTSFRSRTKIYLQRSMEESNVKVRKLQDSNL